MKVPFGVTAPENEKLTYLAVEISHGSSWVNLNDNDNFKINAEETRDSTAKSWRKVTAQSPVLGGNYLVHATPEMVVEQVSVRIFGEDQTALADNYWFCQELFEQFDYRIRWTTNEYREYWRCQLADSMMSRGHVLTHNKMAVMSFPVPRYPDVVRERIN